MNITGKTPQNLPEMIRRAIEEEDNESELAYRIIDYLAQKFNAAVFKSAMTDDSCEKQLMDLWQDITKGVKIYKGKDQ